VVVSDRRKIAQILGNVLENALKFTDGGTTGVEMACEKGSEVSVRVRDTGVGIPADELPNIFEEFHQARSADGDRPDGPGLGLAICRKLGELIGVSITVTSVVGEGSEFVITVPVGPVIDFGGEVT